MRLVYLLVLVATAPVLADHTIPIKAKRQETNSYCYAAVSQEILRELGINASQDEIDSKTHASMPHQGKGRGGQPSDALRAYQLWSQTSGYYPDPETLRALLRRNVGMAANFGGTMGGKKAGHSVLIFGISEDNQYFWVWEPFNDVQMRLTMKEMEARWGTYTDCAWVDPVKQTPENRRYAASLTNSQPVANPTPVMIPQPVQAPRQPVYLPQRVPNSPERIYTPNSFALDRIHQRLDALNNPPRR